VKQLDWWNFETNQLLINCVVTVACDMCHQPDWWKLKQINCLVTVACDMCHLDDIVLHFQRFTVNRFHGTSLSIPGHITLYCVRIGG